MKFRYKGNDISVEGMVLEKDKVYDVEDSFFEKLKATFTSKIEIIKEKKEGNKNDK